MTIATDPISKYNSQIIQYTQTLTLLIGCDDSVFNKTMVLMVAPACSLQIESNPLKIQIRIRPTTQIQIPITTF